jgi:hypothetical protein
MPPVEQPFSSGSALPELAQLSRLDRLQKLKLVWSKLRMGAALAPAWLQPGTWPHMQR